MEKIERNLGIRFDLIYLSKFYNCKPYVEFNLIQHKPRIFHNFYNYQLMELIIIGVEINSMQRVKIFL